MHRGGSIQEGVINRKWTGLGLRELIKLPHTQRAIKCCPAGLQPARALQGRPARVVQEGSRGGRPWARSNRWALTEACWEPGTVLSVSFRYFTATRERVIAKVVTWEVKKRLAEEGAASEQQPWHTPRL